MRKLKINYKDDRTFKDGFEEFILNCRSRSLREGTIKHYLDNTNAIYSKWDVLNKAGLRNILIYEKYLNEKNI